jgi:2-polyprenyl-6-methoxyphenol hydroxylase-like FAD-dependent oxidoreductase
MNAQTADARGSEPRSAYDVIVIGASLAGCTAARLYAQRGLQVALVDHVTDPAAYKKLCTHYIQPSATPVLRRLGIEPLIERAGGIHNTSEFWTPWGWIPAYDPTDATGAPLHGYNIQRKTLDPMMRQLAVQTPGVTAFLGSNVRELVREAGKIKAVRISGPVQATLGARLIVAADGRGSPVGQLMGIVPKESANCRMGVMAGYRGLRLKRGSTTQMWFNGPEVAYIFPNDGDMTVVAYSNTVDQVTTFQRDPAGVMEERMRRLPDGPDLPSSARQSEPLLVKKFMNRWRLPAKDGVCFVGDALMSLDWVWGTGCGFALQQGEWLVDATGDALESGADLQAATAQYAKKVRTEHGLHALLIRDFSRRPNLNPIERLMFSAAVKDEQAARHLHAFGARTISPLKFLSPSAVTHALWVNIKQKQPLPLSPLA